MRAAPLAPQCGSVYDSLPTESGRSFYSCTCLQLGDAPSTLCACVVDPVTGSGRSPDSPGSLGLLSWSTAIFFLSSADSEHFRRNKIYISCSFSKKSWLIESVLMAQIERRSRRTSEVERTRQEALRGVAPSAAVHRDGTMLKLHDMITCVARSRWSRLLRNLLEKRGE